MIRLCLYCIRNYILYNPRIIISIIAIWAYISYNIDTTIYLLDGDSIYELDSRPIYEIDSRSNQAQIIQSFEERQYLPYNPGIVLTSEGYRVELENAEISQQEYGFKRINHPSHYPQTYDFQTGNNNSYRIDEIAPTRSEVEENGIYFGNHIDPKLNRSHIPNHSLFHDVKARIKHSFRKLEDKYESNMFKHIDRKLELEEFYKKKIYRSKHSDYVSENYIRWIGHVNKNEVIQLRKHGYTIHKGKLRKL